MASGLSGGPRFQVGTTIRFTYLSATHDRYKEIFVLNSNWKGKVHGIDMRRLTEAERHVLYTIIDPDSKGHRHGVPLIDDILIRMDPATLIDEPLAFYHQFVRSFLRNKDAYRTYWPHNMSGVTVVRREELKRDGRLPRTTEGEPLFKRPEPPKQTTPTAGTQPGGPLFKKV